MVQFNPEVSHKHVNSYCNNVVTEIDQLSSANVLLFIFDKKRFDFAGIPKKGDLKAIYKFDNRHDAVTFANHYNNINKSVEVAIIENFSAKQIITNIEVRTEEVLLKDV